MSVGILKRSLQRLMVAIDGVPVLSRIQGAIAPQQQIDRIADAAARGCTHLCRRCIKENMDAAGIKVKTRQLLDLIESSVAFYKGNVGGIPQLGFALRRGVERKEKERASKSKSKSFLKKMARRKKASIYIQSWSLEAGAVRSSQRIGARAKRSIKAGTAGAKTYRAVNQLHMVQGSWKSITRAAISPGGITVIPGRHFFQFNQAQAENIANLFRNNFRRLMASHGHKV